MKNWEVTYTENKGTTYQTMIVEARDYTKAYIKVLLKIPMGAMITEVKEI